MSLCLYVYVYISLPPSFSLSTTTSTLLQLQLFYNPLLYSVQHSNTTILLQLPTHYDNRP